MEAAYLDQNRREYEITKHVSLLQLDPLALVLLRESGCCEFRVPEALFDLDCPGHYMRRIKSVSVTIPCVSGPYSGVHCTLTLLSSSFRKVAIVGSRDYVRDFDQDDSRFVDDYRSIQSIVTSSGQGDSGLFDANLRDERYLPFEGSGAISMWRLELPNDFRAFDYDTITDVIIHMRYTARDGGSPLKEKAIGALQSVINRIASTSAEVGLMRLFSVRHEFPSEWHRFLHPANTATIQTLEFVLNKARFPFQFIGRTITLHSAKLYLKLKQDDITYNDEEPLVFGLNNGVISDGPRYEFKVDGSPIDGLAHTAFEGMSIEVSEDSDNWVIEISRAADPQRDGILYPDIPQSLRQKNRIQSDEVMRINSKDYFRLNPNAIEDIWVLCNYSI
jgi:hypothetical protein